METKLLTSKQVKEAGAILKEGGLVGIPTETVYGLAANALDGKAVAKIFEAKGRPQDNPLIVHISDLSELDDLVAYVPPVVYDLADAFWPGPLTIIMDKADIIPDEVSAGLDTVAVRMPSHPVAREIIKAAGVPLAAPSANTSGKPSPTTAAHVMNDMNGKIDAVVDGGSCEVGVESTVITLATRKPKLLRPGRVTPEELEDVLGDELIIDDAVLGKLKDGEKAASPGMKYKHYSPSSDVFVVKGSFEAFKELIGKEATANTAVLVFDGEEKDFDILTLNFGEEDDDLAHAAKLFDALRTCDDKNVEKLYVRCPSDEGVGLAVMNRLLRAAEFKVLEV
ncbi:MAG: threonylcarbamoyl-AMP synthase [Oscillospiraceae bacterium]|nr:threonylcarbamoyl-AMP synthase [Candidatus Limimonas coprohippi]